MKIVCLDGYTTNPGDLSWEPVEKLGEFVCYDRTKPEDVIERAKDADIILTNKVVIKQPQIDKLPNLKYITTLATGYNVVDVEYARKKRIDVSNAPDYSTKAVAQHTFAFILEIMSKIKLHSDSVDQGDWIRSDDFCYWKSPIIDLAGKTIGIIGYGKIGKEVAKIAKAFDMKVLTVKRNRPYETDPNIDFCSLEELLKESDIVSLHCPATKETTGMVNSDFLSKMKRDAILINLARGVIVNEKDVAFALNNNIISFFCADVIEKEPMSPDCPLLVAKNTLITPHIAWASVESRKRLIEITANNITSFINGKPINLVN